MLTFKFEYANLNHQQHEEAKADLLNGMNSMKDDHDRALKMLGERPYRHVTPKCDDDAFIQFGMEECVELSEALKIISDAGQAYYLTKRGRENLEVQK